MKATFPPIGRGFFIVAVSLWIGACGSGDDDGPVFAPSSYTVGGTVSGLSGAGLVLQNNAGNDLTVSTNGSFTFSTSIVSGRAYAVTVKTQPSGPAQTCTVANGSGNVGSGNVTNVQVNCVGLTGHSAFISHFNDNSISVFAIQTDGTLSPIAGSPFASGFAANQEVYRMALSPSGNFLAVAAVSPGGDISQVGVYSVDATTGALTPVSGSPFSTEATAGSGWLEFDRTGNYLYTANYLTEDVTAFSVNSSTGALTKISGSPFAVGGDNPVAVAVDSTNKFVFVLNSESDNVSVFAINSATGALTAVAGSPFATGDWPGTIEFDAHGHVYIANIGTNSNGDPEPGAGTVTAYNLNSTTGALTPLSGSPFAIATNGNISTNRARTHLFVPVIGGLANFEIDATTGALTPTPGSPYAGGENTTEVSVDASDNFAYVTNSDDTTVSGYSINSSTGALSELPNSPFSIGTEPYNIVTK